MASLFLLNFLQGKDVRKRDTRGTLICTSVTEQTSERFHESARESVQMFSAQTSIIGTKATLSREVLGERGTLSTLPQTLQMNYQTLHTLPPERAAKSKAAAVLFSCSLFFLLRTLQ